MNTAHTGGSVTSARHLCCKHFMADCSSWHASTKLICAAVLAAVSYQLRLILQHVITQDVASQDVPGAP